MSTKAVDLQEIKEKTLPRMVLRRDLDTDIESKYDKQILLCGDTSCGSLGGTSMYQAFVDALEKHDLNDKVDVQVVGCFGSCHIGPKAIINPGGRFYADLKAEDAETIVAKDLVGGEVVEELLYPEVRDFLRSNDEEKSLYDIGYYAKQEKIVTHNIGLIDPSSIDEYIAVDGFQALKKTLEEMSPQDVIDEVQASGLRGRGGGGFSTGFKWQSTADSPGDKKYVVLNADEGDPGAYMDRSVLEGDPFVIVEAMTIGAYAVGADQGYIYVRAEYPHAIGALNNAIAKSKEYGLLGDNIMGTDFSFDLECRLGAGAFVCGEETALIASIEGERGIPRSKPPYPAQSGVYGKPTLLNNVETMANIPQIILNGSDWFSSIGVEGCTGTKVFTLAGNAKRTGIIEVPMGITLREVIYDIGGGIKGDKKFKGVQTGGPSGGVVTEEYLDTPVTYENLKELGSSMGSGGMIVMDEDVCMVDLCRFYLDFTVDESCGKCTPCREGTQRLLELLEKFTEGRATDQDLENLESLAHMVTDTSLCGLGQAAPSPILSTLRWFRHEYEDHINGKCAAGKCKLG